MCSFMVPWTHTCLPRKLHLDRFSRFCRIPLLPSHRARVVGPISFCACHTMRSDNCLACIYTRHKTGLESSQVILYWNSHDDKSASILSSDRSIDANRCAQLWCSGTDGKYPSTARAVDATNLLHVAAAYWLRIDGTDRRTPYRYTEARSGQRQ